jgi:hypothetical protein
VSYEVHPSYVDSIDPDDTHTAAGLYLRAKHVATDRNRGIGERQQATRTMHEVNSRFPEAKDVAATAADHEMGIEGDAALKRTRDVHRAEHGLTADQAARHRRTAGGSKSPKAPAATAGPGRRRRGSSSPRPGGGRRGGPRLPRPSVPDVELAPGGVTSWGRMVWQTLGWGLGLSMLYLFVSDKGSGAVGLISRGVTNTVNTLVNPRIDPLSPGSHPSSGAPAHTAPARAPALPARPPSPNVQRVGPYATR